MGKTIPGGVTLDDRGHPTDANGNRLDGLPDHLSEEEVALLRGAGIVAQKQLDHYDVETLTGRFGIGEKLARKAKGEQDLFGAGGEDSEESDVSATGAAEELAEEAGLDLSEIEGSGKDGKVTKPDVEAAIEE